MMNISLLGFLGFMAWAIFQPSHKRKTTRNPSKKRPPSAFRKEKIEGGLADYVPDSEFDKDDLEKGIKVEMEHTNNRNVAKEIAKDHLLEDSRYYDKLEKMEKKKNPNFCLWEAKVKYTHNNQPKETAFVINASTVTDANDKAKKILNKNLSYSKINNLKISRISC